MKLYFTRHGKTEWNKQHRFQGMNGDSPLLPSSFVQIRALGRHLQDVPFAAVYASPSKRAKQTAQGIVSQWEQSVPIFYDANLKEMGYGKIEGKSISKMHEQYPKTLTNMRHRLDLYDPTPFNGETVSAMLDRMTQTIVNASYHYDRPVLFVGHGASMTAAIQFLAGKSYAELREMGGLKNNSLSILETNEQKEPYELTLWNDVSFLPAL
ncbi:histidine phosphatase family protein [Tetragenococcus osmophilus]|uniref:Histidine phosphatase family protein n=1 Tax=Tetragenococcus osmophilus TaxID=526944 RepID=A0AA37XKY6_9ENTE|nr:histidine phosphatase family protein [Tetragenococcus osmophilus]AYW48130.1 histidine phosphatase family protein [Tetragenococcus osmophilus]GMA53890.1 phosphoglycerate mutase [Alicyclobacillus contaminans]GMA72201.1 phosphoglycerate mutase [Tetragenococcus osmophilus]